MVSIVNSTSWIFMATVLYVTMDMKHYLVLYLSLCAAHA